MGYEISRISFGESQGYVLRGEGEHSGTNETILEDDMEALMQVVRRHLRDRYKDYSPPRFSFWNTPAADPREALAVVEFLDMRFEAAHSMRQHACESVAKFTRELMRLPLNTP